MATPSMQPETEVNVIMRMPADVFARHLREFARHNPGEFRRMLNEIRRRESPGPLTPPGGLR